MQPAEISAGISSVTIPSVDQASVKRLLRKTGSGRRGRGPLRRSMRLLFFALIVLTLIPLVLTVIYAVPPVRPISTLMIGDSFTGQAYDRRWVPLEDISPNLRHSVIMSEDGKFCSHRGIDWGEMKLVVKSALAGETTRGASTIPMQAVKNLYLWNSRSFVRKVAEAPLAVYFDVVLSKRRILEIYLNIVEWGPNIYGAEAAAQYHFGKSAKSLTSRQAALLAVSLPDPKGRNPGKPSRNLSRLAQLIEKRASRAGAYVGCVD